MKKSTKIWVVLAFFFIILGSVMFVSVLAVNNWDFSKTGSVKYQSNTYEIEENFDNISIFSDTADVVFKYHDSEKCKVVLFEEEKINHFAFVEENTLKIEQNDNRKWFDYIHFFSFGRTTVTVYLPKHDYLSLNVETDTSDIKIPKDFKFQNLKISGDTSSVSLFASVSKKTDINLSTGDIKINSVNLGNLKVSTTTGDISLSSVKCEEKISANVSTGSLNFYNVTAKNLTSSGSTGEVNFNNVKIDEKLSVNRSTGDILFTDSDAGEIFIKTDTGDVRGSLISNKIFITSTDTGSVSVPKTTSGGKCEIITDTGDIKLSVNG